MRASPSLVAAALLMATPAQARTDHDAAAWLNLTAMGTVTGDMVYFAEVQPRFADDVSRLSQLLLRPAIGVRLNERVTLYQGYAHIEERGAKGMRSRNEERAFQQLSWTLRKADGADLSARTRFEQRWRSDGAGMSLRLRQMLRYERALDDRPRSVAALGSVEAFVGVKAADWGGSEGFDQVRTFLGIEIPLAGATTIEAGYLNQLRDAPGRDIGMTHALSLALFVRH